MSRRVVFLSSGGTFPRDVLAALDRRGGRVDAHLVYSGVAGAPASGGTAFRRAARALRDRLDSRLRTAARETVFTGPLNGPRMASDLARLRPSVVILGRCALIDPRILEIPAEATVNVHPGLLPWIRGNSPLGNSLLRWIPLGCTAFRVDAGIDTGKLLDRRLVPIVGGETIEEIRDSLYALWVQMTADLIPLVRDGVPPGIDQPRRFPICHTLAGPAHPAVAEAIANGRPLALLRRWAPLCDGLRLPLDAEALSDVPVDG
jgi:methionyl-tRNA formyltransferase